MTFEEIKEMVKRWESHGGDESPSVEGALNVLINQIHLELFSTYDLSFTRVMFDVPERFEVVSLPVDIMTIIDAFTSGGRPINRKDRAWQKEKRAKIISRGTPTFSYDESARSTVYNTGTIDLPNGSATVTGTGTVFTSSMISRVIKADGDDEHYWIQSVDSTTQLTLTATRSGTALTTAAFKIDEKDSLRIRFLPEISGSETAEFLCNIRPPELADDTDVPVLPAQYHAYLVWEARFQRLVNDEERQDLYRLALQKSQALLKMILVREAVAMHGGRSPAMRKK